MDDTPAQNGETSLNFSTQTCLKTSSHNVDDVL